MILFNAQVLIRRDIQEENEFKRKYDSTMVVVLLKDL